MKLTNIKSFNNFRGLFTKDESGLVPSDSESGVYASEIQNVVCKDGTIRPVGGYIPEEDDGTEVTFATNTSENIVSGYSFTILDGTNRRVLFGNDGVAYAYCEDQKKYVILKDWSALITPNFSDNYSAVNYANVLASAPFRNQFFFSGGTGGPHYWWNCTMGSLASTTATTIVLDASASSFFTAANLQVIIDGTEYAYTGVSGSTLTGVSPDPTLAGHAVGACVLQSPVENETNIISALGQAPTIHFWYKGRLGIASHVRSNLVLSEVGGPTDFTNRSAGGYVAMNIGDGGGAVDAVMTLRDSFVVGKKDALIAVLIKQESATVEYTKIANIVNRKNIGPVHRTAWCGAENEVYYISHDKQFKRIKQLADGTEFPISETVNEDMAPTMLGFEYDNTRLVYFEDSVYVACREGNENDTVIEYDTKKNTYYVHKKPVASWIVHENKLYFTDPYEMQVYEWKGGKDGFWDDNDGAVASLWKSGRLKFDDFFKMKVATAFGVYLRMSELTTVNCQIDYNNLGTLYTTNFDIRGDGTSAGVTTSTIQGLDTETSDSLTTESGDILTTEGEETTVNVPGFYITSTPITSSYGTNAYGIEPYGSRNMALNDEGMFDVVIFKTLPVKYKPYDITVTFSSNDVGQNYRIIDFGFVQEAEESLPKKAIAQ